VRLGFISLLGAILFLCLSATGSHADPFAFGDVTLSQRSSIANTSYYDTQAGVQLSTRVNLENGEPYLRYEMVFSEGQRDAAPNFSRQLTIFATERNEPYFMEFEGSSDHRQPPPAPYKMETLRDCQKSAETLGGKVWSAREVSGLTVFVVLDPDLSVDVREQSRAAIERWTAAVAVPRGSPGRASISPSDLAFLIDFKNFADILGPQFRGAVISCSVSDVGLKVGWLTRFIDVSLAGTVFNLAPLYPGP
jgi:hypothetical protein